MYGLLKPFSRIQFGGTIRSISFSLFKGNKERNKNNKSVIYKNNIRSMKNMNILQVMVVGICIYLIYHWKKHNKIYDLCICICVQKPEKYIIKSNTLQNPVLPTVNKQKEIFQARSRGLKILC